MVKIVNRADITQLPGHIGRNIKDAEKSVSMRLDALGNVGNMLEKQREAYKKRCAELLTAKSTERKGCEDSLYTFLERAWPSMERNDFCLGFHLEAVAEHLEAVSRGEINRLLINIPPRTGKTNCVSIAWPAWTWAQQEITDLTGPQVQWLCASYGHSLALDISTKCRRLIESDWYQNYWGDRFDLMSDQNTKSRYDTSSGGSRIATSVGGALTGLGADIIICLPYESMVLSDKGWLHIGDIVENKIPVKIAGWDGHKIIWQDIEKYEKNPFRQLYEVDFGDGKICCTEDHPIYTSRGYISAKDITCGEEVWSYGMETMPRMRKDDVFEAKSHGQDKVLQHRLSICKEGEKRSYTKQQAMRKMRRESISFTSSHGKSVRGYDILQQGMFWKGLQRSKESCLCRWMQGALLLVQNRVHKGQAKTKVLFSKMFWTCKQIAKQRMSKLQNIIQTIYYYHNILLSEMRRYIPFGKDARLWQWEICSWAGSEEISSRVERELYQDYNGKRRKYLPVMRYDARAAQEGAACPPYRLCEGEFTANEFNNPMQILPRADAREIRTEKKLVRKIVKSSKPISRIEKFTYNVRVNPCHNYFAEGILVHNCDDVHNAQEIESQLVIQSAVRWFSEGLQSRLNNPKTGAIVVIMQRLSDEDLSGYILSKESGYTHLNLPLEYESSRHCITNIGWTDPRTEEGELLCPARIGEDEVIKLKKDLGSFAFSGQYQQSPTPRGGGIIKDKWWKLYPEQGELMDEITGKPAHPLEYPAMEFIIAFADTAYTTKEENDYSALTVWGVFRKDGAPKVMLMAGWKERLELNELVNKINSTCSAGKGIPIDRLLIENKASGKSVGQEINRLFDNAQFGIEMVEPKGDKVARMYAVQHLFENGIVYAPDREWAQMVINDVAKFPKGSHDDIADTCSGALLWLRNSNFALRSDEHDTEELEKDMYRKPNLPLYDV